MLLQVAGGAGNVVWAANLALFVLPGKPAPADNQIKHVGSPLLNARRFNG
jgi:predicted metal-binding membrane protein